MTVQFRYIPVLAAAIAVSTGGCVRQPQAQPASMTPAPDATLADCPRPQSFPAGYDYPQAAGTVEQWVAAGNVARARQHGWNLWAGLNRDDGAGPVWRSWCTSTQAFAPLSSGTVNAQAGTSRAAVHASLNSVRASHGLTTTSEDPINLPGAPGYPVPEPIRTAYPSCVQPGAGGRLDSLKDGPTYQSNGDIMVAVVSYDPVAFEAIRNRLLFTNGALDPLVPTASGTAAIAPLPSGSIVLKSMLWPVMGAGITALPVWSGAPAFDDGSYAGFEIQSKWPDGVAVTAQTVNPGARADVSYLHGVYTSGMLGRRLLPQITYRAAPVVSVQEFYNYRPNLSTMHECDRAILDASAYWAYGRAFAQSDYLVMVAMHIMTKEQPAWTFQSVWWDNRSSSGAAAADRPSMPTAQGPWGNYQMASTYGIPDPADRTRWPVAFNPYIELAADHPVQTNCMNCHHRAAWPADRSSYEAKDGPDALQVYGQQNGIFNGLLTLDSMWGISDRVAPARRGVKEH